MFGSMPHWELYSLYDHDDDLRSEKDIRNFRQEAFRQRIFIEQQNYEILRLQAELTLLRGSKYDWAKLSWKLVQDFKAGKQSKEDFIEEYERYMHDEVRIV